MSVKRNIAANYLGQAWIAVMGLAFVPLYIRYLGMEAYGLIGVFAMLQTWLSLLDFGLAPTLTREMARPIVNAEDTQLRWNLLRSIELAIAALALSTAAMLWTGADWIATAWLRAQRLPAITVANACALMGVVVALRFIENLYRGGIVGLQKQVELNLATSLLATLRGAGAVAVLAWVSNSIEAFFAWQAMVSLLSAAVLAAMVYRALPAPAARPSFRWDSLRSIGRFSTNTFAIAALGFLLSQTDKLVLSKMLALADFGYYALAAVLATYVRLLATSIDQAVYPRFVELHSRGQFDELARYYHRATQLSVVLMGGLGVALGMFGDHFLLAWTGDRDLAARTAPLLWMLLVGMVANGLLNGPYYLQMAAGWTSMLLKTNIAMAFIFVPGLLLAVARYGAVGAAASWALFNVVYMAIVVGLMHRRLLPAEKWRWYLEDLGRPLGSAFVTALAMRLVLPSPDVASWSAVIFVIGCATSLLAATVAAPHVRSALASKFARVPRHA